MFLVLFLAPANPVGTGLSTGSGITSIMSADTLTTPSIDNSNLHVERPQADRGNGCSTGSWPRGETHMFIKGPQAVVSFRRR